mgnify:FL=1
MLEIRGLTMRYRGGGGVGPLDLVVEAGQVAGVVGPNGAGKSTLFNLLAGVSRPQGGTVRVRTAQGAATGGRVPAHLLGYLPQDVPDLPRLSALDLCVLDSCMRGLDLDAQDLRAHLQAYGCGALVRRRLDSLSRGQARRVYLAAAFLGDPPVIVLDEPTNDLDVETTLALSTWVTQAAGRGSAVLVSSHVLGFLDRICHHVTLLRDGLAAATLRADQEDTESVYRRVFALRQLP